MDTHHHSTPAESMRLRKHAENEFSFLHLTLYESDSNLRILYAGCGPGFLCYFAARVAHNARIAGNDIFGHCSISDSSVERAKVNVRKLGF